MSRKRGFAQIIDQVALDAGLTRDRALHGVKLISQCLFKEQINGRPGAEKRQQGKTQKSRAKRPKNRAQQKEQGAPAQAAPEK